jgi:hypothetical protein
MPISLNNSNISVTYNTGSNYIIETVKSDLYVRDTRTGISSNLFAEPVVNPYVIATDVYFPRIPSTNSYTWTDSGYTVSVKVSDAVLDTGYVYKLFNHIITSQDHYHSLPSYTATGNTYAGATRFKTFAGIAISIDFGRSIYPERMRIAPRPLQSGFTGNDFIVGAPKAFKIFASDDASCWNDNNHSSWTQIHDQTTSLSYVNEQYTIVNFTPNLPKYRYYTMVVLSTIGNYAGGYMMFSEWNIGGDEKIDAIPEGTLNKRLNFTYDVTKNVEYLAQQKTGVGGWRIVRFLPPTSTGNYPITDDLAGTTSVGNAYNYTNFWTIPFGTFDEFVFSTFNMKYWLQTTKVQAIGTYYANSPRTIIKSSISSTSYTANWYHRDGTPEDPQIGLRNHRIQPYGNIEGGGDLVLYNQHNPAYSSSADISVNIDGGLCVLVRNSSTSTSITVPNIYTLTFPVRTLVDVNNNSNLILQGDYNVNVGHPTSSLLPAITNTSNTLIPLPNTTTSNVSVRYHLLNPVKTTEGAQWTYSSNNPNVYHLGNVGIGTTNPEYNLDVRGNIYTSIGGYTGSTLTTWSITSDRRIKENIVKASYEKCLENVNKIELYNFNFKDNCVNTNDKHQLGFIAQEVREVYPKAVEVNKMILNTNETIDDILTLNTTQIDYTLYGAVKNLIEKIDNIDIELENLGSNITYNKDLIRNTSNIFSIITSNISITTSNIFTGTSNISITTSNISIITSNIFISTSNIPTETSNIPTET